jgi:hypothetical protein
MDRDKHETQPCIDWDAIDAHIVALVKQHLEAEHQRVYEVVAGALDDIAAKNERQAKDQINVLRIQCEKLDSLFTEWRRYLKGDGLGGGPPFRGLGGGSSYPPGAANRVFPAHFGNS